MSVASIVNSKGELQYDKIAVSNVRFINAVPNENLSGAIIKALLLRIEALETYILAHQETYIIQDAEGNHVRLVVAPE